MIQDAKNMFTKILFPEELRLLFPLLEMSKILFFLADILYLPSYSIYDIVFYLFIF